MKRAIFLDRDGIINKVVVKEGLPLGPRRVEEFVLVDGIKDALICFRREGFLNIVNTNQPDVSRGVLSEEELMKMHELIRKELPVDDIFVCPHDDRDNCFCRKPRPGMLLEASRKWKIDLKNSFAVGDRWKDVEAGRAAGCRAILLDQIYNRGVDCDFRISDIREVIDIVRKYKEEI